MTRNERDELIQVLHRVDIGDRSLALYMLRKLIRAADVEHAAEDAANTSRAQQEVNDGGGDRPL